MRKLYLIITMLFATTLLGFSKEEEKENVPVEVTPPITGKPVQRTPIKLDLAVWYYPQTKQLEVISRSYVDGEVYLYFGGEVIDHSPSINSIFLLPEIRGKYTIDICADSWKATGSIEL